MIYNNLNVIQALNSGESARDNNCDANKQRSSDHPEKCAGHQERGGKWIRRRQFYAAKRQQKWLNKETSRRLHETEKERILQEERARTEIGRSRSGGQGHDGLSRAPQPPQGPYPPPPPGTYVSVAGANVPERLLYT
ncbi:hypothetical protein TSAR_009657 [Trichomalopsis sarcophagae]|uniref:Uncharacterized protein n=1 Tax=Trichomalopsis sarcophagae TaxID=543379 RepID=A0A232ELP4_9HYME|nr:hypothetical protein TSAR_009657 [Trichomalopsis sarcophagae]